MGKASQSALTRYKARRRGLDPDEVRPRRRLAAGRLALLLAVGAVLGGGLGALLVRDPQPLQLDYEIDLDEAPRGSLTIRLDIGGRMPRHLDLALAGDLPARPGERPHTPTAHELRENGAAGRPLTVTRQGDGWRLETGGADRARFVYRVDLARAAGAEQDIRRHISTLVNGGVRAAGFEIFLVPVAAPVADVTVSLRNPRGLPVLAPWPSLVQGSARAAARLDSSSRAHLGAGQGYLPAEAAPPPAVPATPDPPAPGTQLLYHPRDIEDLNNALLVCGDLRTAATRARDCVIRYATDRDWLFEDDEALDLVRRIARTELGFFGSAPNPTITVLLAANEVTAADGFDVYGVHTGSSVLVMIDRGTTWGELEDHAASVIAHEMFHGWLGEAIPQQDPRMLWFTEGATTWYAARMLTSAGVWSSDYARQNLRGRLERDYARSELLGTLSVADAAAAVMAEAAQVRFAYAGGVAACAALDAWLARHAGIERPMDGVLRHLYDHRDGTPLTRRGLVEAVRRVTGVDCDPWLERHVYGKTALPVPDELI